ncbi:hypothetical protein Misp02_60000 [Microtetraspora sp. NBRC 16547]|nr:hypothetical protein Misp02_60000 [Microtetraspora sp. NBRC 16547]
MDIIEMIEQAQDKPTVKRVFGEPIVQEGITVIPVARVAGGGGGGSGRQEGDNPGEGVGAGFGLGAAPAGVFVIKDGTVRWQPVVDVNKLVIGCQIVMVVALLTVRTIARLRARKR